MFDRRERSGSFDFSEMVGPFVDVKPIHKSYKELFSKLKL